MRWHEAMAYVRSLYPDAKLERWQGRYIVVNVMGEGFSLDNRLARYIRPERAWKKTALRIKRRAR